MVNFNGDSYLVYQSLSDRDKISFLYESNTEGVKPTLDKYLRKYLKGFKVREDGTDNLFMYSYLTEDDQKVNIFLHDSVYHVNCDRIGPIRDFVHKIMEEGDILLFQPEFVKTRNNRDRYHLRFYRAYRRINGEEGRTYPLCYS
jgi:hypothetical protein